MNYKHIVQAEFVDRPNRFIAHVMLEGSLETVHVKNTGRCKELLQPGAIVYLEKSDNPSRSTAYDLVAVRKGERLINMDSQAPNKVVEEWLREKKLFPNLILLRPETQYGNSRFDFYVETTEEKIFIEVKGVTREEAGVVCFPDAPSERALKHVEELVRAKEEGYRVFVLFVVQMSNVKYFTPDIERHEAFAEAIRHAAYKGVEVLAYDCVVTPDSLKIRDSVPVNLENVKEILRGYDLSAISNPLLAWYDKERRILPWRELPTPYRVWVSEIMLQQTRVEAVKPYFERFMSELPDIESLAKASEEKILKLWEGLGYYNRVRNLQKAALQIMEDYDGKMPQQYESILSLKGIGSYTAGAISSIAFGLVHPAVDGNVLRVLARLRMDERFINEEKVKSSVEQELRESMPVDRPGDFNQAMMELGACVCIPNGSPHCEECPLGHICQAHRAGKEMDFPQKIRSRDRKIEEKTILVIQDENKVALHKRPSKGLLAGMYEFPSLDGRLPSKQVVSYLEGRGMHIIRITPLDQAKHIFTHKEWHMTGYLVRVDELERMEALPKQKDWIYVEPQETRERFPIPSAFYAYTKYLNIKHGSKRIREE